MSRKPSTNRANLALHLFDSAIASARQTRTISLTQNKKGLTASANKTIKLLKQALEYSKPESEAKKKGRTACPECGLLGGRCVHSVAMRSGVRDLLRTGTMADGSKSSDFNK